MKDLSNFGSPFQETLKNYNPMTWWQDLIHPQIFIGNNIQDEGVEKHVLREVGSYGKQLGTIIRVIDLLVSRLNPEELLPDEKEVVEEYNVLSRSVKSAVAEFKGTEPRGISSREIMDLEGTLKAYAVKDRKSYDTLVDLLQKMIKETERASK